MAPDLNSLPPSYAADSPPFGSAHPRNLSNGDPPSPSPRSTSLAAAATINAGIQNQSSRRSSTSSSRNNRGSPVIGRAEGSRRRSIVAMNLNLNDPALPGPGELQGPERHQSSATSSHLPFYATSSPQSLSRSPTIPTGGDPHHNRAPSIGELHQELEQEQEAQVNRLLQTIRHQQIQLQALQRDRDASNPSTVSSSFPTTAVDDTPTSERSSLSFATGHPSRARSPVHQRPSVEASRRSSRSSPALRPRSSGLQQLGSDNTPLGPTSAERDEAAFYQAETQNLTRENQMLRLRVRELERQLSERASIASPSGIGGSGTTPSIHSNLASSAG